jgi:hypothetical protein
MASCRFPSTDLKFFLSSVYLVSHPGISSSRRHVPRPPPSSFDPSPPLPCLDGPWVPPPPHLLPNTRGMRAVASPLSACSRPPLPNATALPLRPPFSSSPSLGEGHLHQGQVHPECRDQRTSMRGANPIKICFVIWIDYSIR